jgi:PiT family inorganic phosphate transporter
MGVGFAKNPHALKLTVIERIVWAWVLTIPAAAAVSWSMVSVLLLLH